jgi:hypothetical protein
MPRTELIAQLKVKFPDFVGYFNFPIFSSFPQTFPESKAHTVDEKSQTSLFGFDDSFIQYKADDGIKFGQILEIQSDVFVVQGLEKIKEIVHKCWEVKEGEKKTIKKELFQHKLIGVCCFSKIFVAYHFSSYLD